MDDEDGGSADCDAETCMVVEIQENELGEIMLVERPREEVFANNRFCVVDCEIDSAAVDQTPIKTEHLPESIEIVYLPDYSNPDGEPVMLKQELVLDNENAEEDYEAPDSESYEIAEEEEEEEEDEEDEDTFLSVRPDTPPKVYHRNHKRTFAEIGSRPKKLLNGFVPENVAPRFRSNSNILLKHNGVFHEHSRPWARKLSCKDFAHSKSISSVTTIHTKPKIKLESDGLELKTIVPDSKVIVKNSPNNRMLSTMPHKCQYCDRSFRQSVSLQIHSTLHSQSIPDSCLVS